MTDLDLVRRLLAESGLTQQQIADAAGVSQRCVSEFLAGKTTPRFENVQKLEQVAQRSAHREPA